MHGWIGGACAEPVVIREAQRAIEDGEPAAAPPRHPRAVRRTMPDGMTVIPISCQSEGALEVYVEPVVPSPSPGRRGPLADGAHPGRPGRRRSAGGRTWSTSPTSAGAGRDARSVVVVATQGHGDEEAMEQAVAGRPGLRRSGRLAQAGRGGARLPRRPRRPPASCSTGCGSRSGSTSATRHTARSPSPILAELVAATGHGALGPEPPADRPAVEHTAVDRAPATAIDLVCGMTVTADETSRPFEHDGDDLLLLLRRAAATAFEKDPAALPDSRGGAMLIKNDFEVAQPRRQGLGVLRGHPAGGRLPARAPS